MADNDTSESNEVLYTEPLEDLGPPEDWADVHAGEQAMVSATPEDLELMAAEEAERSLPTPKEFIEDQKAHEASIKRAKAAAAAKVRKTAEALLYQTDRPDLSTQQICFLRDNMPQIVQESKSTINWKGWQSFATVEDNDISSFASKMFGQLGAGTRLLGISTLEKSFLVPRIYLKKVVIDPATNKIVKDIPMYFPNNSSGHINAILNAGIQDDYGIINASIDFKNQNPFSAGRMVDVSLQIYLANAGSLTRNRGGYTVADLILRRNQVDPKVYDGGHYQVVLEIGYQKPNISQGMISPALKEGIDRSVVSMTLQMVDYDLSFEQNGVLSLNIDYKARIEALLEDKDKYDIFNGALKEGAGGTENYVQKIKDHQTLTAQLMGQRDEYQQRLNNVFTSGEAIRFDPNNPDDIEVGQSWWEAPVALVSPITRLVHDPFEEDAHITKNEKVRLQLQEAHNNINRTERAISQNIADTQKAKEALASLKYENKIAKYGRLFELLYERGKVRSFVVDAGHLVTYGPEFDKKIKKEVDEALNLGDPELAQALDDEMERIREELRDSVRTHFVNSGNKGSVDVNFEEDFKNYAMEFASKQGSSDWTSFAKDALETFDIGSTVDPRYKTGTGTSGRADSRGLSGKKIIYWVYAGDIIDAGLSMFGISKEMRKNNIKTIMGPINLPIGKSTVYNTSIPDIPITLDAFQKYFYKNIISKDVDQYYVINFLRDVVHKLVGAAVNQRCFGKSMHKPVKMKANVMETKKDLFIHSARYGVNLTANKSKTVSILNASRSQTLYLSSNDLNMDGVPSNQRDNVIMYYGTDGRINKKWTGNRSYDEARGIYHFYIGQDRGLVKEVKFTKNKGKYQTEMMVERGMASNEEYLELWAIFDIQLTMVGNSLLRPGMHIFLNPDAAQFGTLSKALGLGGYYMVISVSNSIGKDGWETSVIAKWVSGGANATGSEVTKIAPRVATAAEYKDLEQGKAETPPTEIQEAEQRLEGEGKKLEKAVTMKTGAGTITVGAAGPTHGETADTATEYDETMEMLSSPTEEYESEKEAMEPFGGYASKPKELEGGGTLLYSVEDDGFGYVFGQSGEGGMDIVGYVTPHTYGGPAGNFSSKYDYRTYGRGPTYEWLEQTERDFYNNYEGEKPPELIYSTDFANEGEFRRNEQGEVIFSPQVSYSGPNSDTKYAKDAQAHISEKIVEKFKTPQQSKQGGLMLAQPPDPGEEVNY